MVHSKERFRPCTARAAQTVRTGSSQICFESNEQNALKEGEIGWFRLFFKRDESEIVDVLR